MSPRGPGRREIAKAQKRARILAAARSLMSEKGYAQMSMSEVASRADVAAGTVFQYAATKAELLMMVTENIWADHINDTLDATPDPGHRSPAAVVDAIMDSLAPVFDMAVHWPETTVWIAREILFGEDLPHRREVLVLVEKLENHIARMLAGCRSAAHAGTTPLDVGARMIVTSGLAELNRARQEVGEDHRGSGLLDGRRETIEQPRADRRSQGDELDVAHGQPTGQGRASLARTIGTPDGWNGGGPTHDLLSSSHR